MTPFAWNALQFYFTLSKDEMMLSLIHFYTIEQRISIQHSVLFLSFYFAETLYFRHQK